MIVAYTQSNDGERAVRVDAAINRGGWFGKAWLIFVPRGFEANVALVEADCEGDAIDTLADSSRGHWINSDPCDWCQANATNPDATDDEYANCTCDLAGNDSHPVDIESVRMERVVRVDYFAKSMPQTN